MLNQYEDVLTIKEVQEILSIGRTLAYSLVKSGEIPSVKVGKKYRITKDAVLRYLGYQQNTNLSSFSG